MDVLNADALKALKRRTDFQIAVTRLPRGFPPLFGAALGIGAYQLEKRLLQPVHPRFGRKLGFRQEFIAVHDLATPEALADALIASSCVPPFMPVLQIGGTAAFDGGHPREGERQALVGRWLDPQEWGAAGYLPDGILGEAGLTKRKCPRVRASYCNARSSKFVNKPHNVASALLRTQSLVNCRAGERMPRHRRGPAHRLGGCRPDWSGRTG